MMDNIAETYDWYLNNECPIANVKSQFREQQVYLVERLTNYKINNSIWKIYEACRMEWMHLMICIV